MSKFVVEKKKAILKGEGAPKKKSKKDKSNTSKLYISVLGEQIKVGTVKFNKKGKVVLSLKSLVEDASINTGNKSTINITAVLDSFSLLDSTGHSNVKYKLLYDGKTEIRTFNTHLIKKGHDYVSVNVDFSNYPIIPLPTLPSFEVK